MNNQFKRSLALLSKYRLILINSVSLIGTLVVSSGLGFGFWWIVARQFTLADAGIASAVISSMMLLGTVGMMGMGTLLIGELSRHHRMELSMIVTAMVLSAGVATLFGAVFALAGSLVSRDFVVLTSSWKNFLLFVAGVGVTGMVFVLDQALLGVLRGGWQLWRNSVFSLGKLLLLIPLGILLSRTGAMGVYATWLAGNILSLFFLVWFVRRNPIPQSSLRFLWRVFWDLRFFAFAHHALP